MFGPNRDSSAIPSPFLQTASDLRRDSKTAQPEGDDFILPGAVPLEIEPGDIMFHHVAVVHGSPENHSPALRRTLYVHYMTDETVADAYSDWPDLLSAEENVRVWSAALQERDGAGRFTVTPGGLQPVEKS